MVAEHRRFTHQRNRSSQILLLSVFLLGSSVLTFGAQEEKKHEPLTEVSVIDLLKGGVPPDRVVSLAREFGIAFQVTPAVERDLRAAGANDQLVQTLREIAPKPVESKPEAPLASSRPALIIECTPGGAQVFVDDELIARTSTQGRLKITTLTAGQHHVRVSLEGYRDFEQTTDLAASGTTIVTGTLESTMATLAKPQPATTRVTTKAYFGVLIQSLTAETAKALKVPDTSGALVQQVAPEGPAAVAGVKPGDVIRSFHDQSVASAEDLMSRVGTERPGTEVRVALLRSGKPISLQVRLTAPPADLAQSVRVTKGTLRGLTLIELTSLWRKALDLPTETQGVVVNGIEPDSPAANAGLTKGLVILQVNGVPVSSLDAFPALAEKAVGDTILLVHAEGKDASIKVSDVP